MSIVMVSRYLSQSKQLHSCGLRSVELCTLRPSYWIFPTSLLMVSYYMYMYVQLPQFNILSVFIQCSSGIATLYMYMLHPHYLFCSNKFFIHAHTY